MIYFLFSFLFDTYFKIFQISFSKKDHIHILLFIFLKTQATRKNAVPK